MLNIIDLLYPKRCVLCGDILLIDNSSCFCDNCSSNINFNPMLSCIKCGKPLSSENNICYACTIKKHKYVRNFSVFKYDDISNSIITGKYNYRPYNFVEYGKIMADYFSKNIDINIDYIIPIPIHKKRYRLRGFNQAEILARQISNCLNIPLLTNVLLRTKNTKSQSSLKNALLRKKNLIGAFYVTNNSEIFIKNILLIDDIYTTGSTINACCEVLLDSGVKNVYSFCLSIVSKKSNYT